MGISSAAKTVLVPWDPESKDHYDRMVEQRKACGWRVAEVPAWKEKQPKGIKMLYWVVSFSLPVSFSHPRQVYIHIFPQNPALMK